MHGKSGAFGSSRKHGRVHSGVTMDPRTIWLHRDAPPKPAFGAPCNGCGTCCAAEPCPLGMLFSLRTRGRCRMLRFDAGASRYRCGVLPTSDAADRGARTATWADWSRRVARRLVARWIGAGIGCDSSNEAIAARR